MQRLFGGFMRVALYARVSTKDQSAEMQVQALRAYCKARGWETHHEYVDEHVGGATRKRPALQSMMRDAAAKKFDGVLVWKFDRLFRSVSDMLDYLERFRCLAIEFISLTEAIDTTTPAGRMVYTLLAAMGEFERELTFKRTIAGVARARAAGKHLGRPAAVMDDKFLLELRSGDHPLSFAAIAKKTGIPQTIVFRRLKNLKGDTASH
jgi:DNA invertase Pin-like site-specific DNA recombinase